MIFFQRMEVMRLMRPAATEATLSYDLILILWWHAETLSCGAATIARSLVGGPRFWFWVAGWLFSLAVAWVCSFLVFLYYRSNSSSIASLAAIRSNTESVVCIVVIVMIGSVVLIAVEFFIVAYVTKT